MDRRNGVATMGELARVRAALAFRPNPDKRRRDELLGLEADDPLAPVRGFCEIDGRTLRTLIDERFVDALRRHHDSPTPAEMVGFMERWDAVLSHGFVDEADPDDWRVVIEGLECDLTMYPGVAGEVLREEFSWFCGDAAEYVEEMDYVYAWWG